MLIVESICVVIIVVTVIDVKMLIDISIGYKIFLMIGFIDMKNV